MHFQSVPIEVANRKDLTIPEKLVAGYIWQRTAMKRATGHVAIKSSWICEDWGLNPYTVSSAINRLARIGLIDIIQASDGSAYKWTGNPMGGGARFVGGGEIGGQERGSF